MKYLFLLFICLAFTGVSCKKNVTCITATITQIGTPCSQWGIKINQIYPSSNIPLEFQQEGLMVCVEYELYEDMRVCACCGGTWANIKSIKLPAD